MTGNRRLISLVMIVILLLSLAGDAWASFADTQGTRYADSADYLRGLGVLVGDPSGLFRPQASITRAEAAKIIVAAVGAGEMVAAAPGVAAFPDTAGHWANGYIRAARDLGIVNGFLDGTFGPQLQVTYAQMVKMLLEASGNGPLPGLAWPENYMAAAQAKGMLAGLPGTQANSPANRGDCAILAAYVVRHVTAASTGQTLAQSVFGKAAGITVAPEEHTCVVGATVQLSAVVRNSTGSPVAGLPIGWETTDPTRASVTQAGLFTAAASGIYRVTATSAGYSSTATITVLGSPIALRAGPATQAITATVQSKARIAVEVVDAWGVKVEGSPPVDVTVAYATGGNNGAIAIGTAKVTTEDGVATFEFSGKSTAGRTDTLVFRAAGLAEATAQVSAVAQAPKSVILRSDPTSLQSNVSVAGTVTATILDQSGVKMATSGTSVVFSITGPGTFASASIAPRTRSTTGGEASVDIYSVAGGTGMITITAEVTGLEPALLYIPTYIGANPDALRARVLDSTVLAGQTSTSGNVAKLLVDMVDSEGRPAASAVPVKLTVQLEDGSPLSSIGLKTTGDLTIDAGHTSTGDIYILAAGTTSGTVGTYRLEVIADVAHLSAAPLTVTVEPSTARFLKTDVTESTKLPLGALTIPVKVQVTDLAGNPIPQAGLAIAAGWQDPGGNNKGRPTINGVYDPPASVTSTGAVKATTDAMGQATFTLAVDPQLGDDYRLDFRSGTMGVTTATMTVVTTGAGSTSVRILNAGGAAITRVRADNGHAAYLEALVADAFDNPLPGWNVTVQFGNSGANVRAVTVTMGASVQSYSNGTLVVRTVNAPGSDSHGKIGVSFEGSLAGSYTITVKPDGAIPTAIATRSFRTDPGIVMSGLRLYTAEGKLATNQTVEGDTPFELRLVISDYGGNAIQAPYAMKVLVSQERGLYSSSAGGEFRLAPASSAIGQGDHITMARGSTQTPVFYVQHLKQSGVSFGIRTTAEAYRMLELSVASAEMVTGSPGRARVTLQVRDAAGSAAPSVQLDLNASAGSLSATSGLTNTEGKVTVEWTGGTGGAILVRVLGYDLADGSEVILSVGWPES